MSLQFKTKSQIRLMTMTKAVIYAAIGAGAIYAFCIRTTVEYFGLSIDNVHLVASFVLFGLVCVMIACHLSMDSRITEADTVDLKNLAENIRCINDPQLEAQVTNAFENSLVITKHDCLKIQQMAEYAQRKKMFHTELTKCSGSANIVSEQQTVF